MNISTRIKRIGMNMVAGSLCSLSFVIGAQQLEVPEQLTQHDNLSTIELNYADLNEVLSLSVLQVGRSYRQKAPSSRAKIGTRIKVNRKVNTALEGNRFNFESFKNVNNKAVLTKIRQSLENVPDELPLNLLNSNEQLAYWLNLYNVALLEKISEIYPKTNLEDELFDTDGLLAKRFLKVKGINLSLNDIQFNIVFPKYGYTPQVMYGFQLGIIGGPNISAEAYTGKNVFRLLDKNAEDFINSNRGTYEGNKEELRVSSLYLRNSVLFPNFEADLKKHLNYYIDSEYSTLLDDANKLVADISDTNIADLTGGYREIGGSAATSSAALMGAVVAGGPANVSGVGAVNPDYIAESMQKKISEFGRYPQDVLLMIQQLERNKNIKEGRVIIKQSENNQETEKQKVQVEDKENK